MARLASSIDSHMNANRGVRITPLRWIGTARASCGKSNSRFRPYQGSSNASLAGKIPAQRFDWCFDKGEAAGELPIERPTTFELVVNLKNPEAMGITV
jgi:hypothetical protein